MAPTISYTQQGENAVANKARPNGLCLAGILHLVGGDTVLRDVLLVPVIPDQLIDAHPPNVPRSYPIVVRTKRADECEVPGQQI